MYTPTEEPRYIPAADPALQTDVLPEREPLTHPALPWAEVAAR